MENIKKYDLELYECLELELTREKNSLILNYNEAEFEADLGIA